MSGEQITNGEETYIVTPVPENLRYKIPTEALLKQITVGLNITDLINTPSNTPTIDDGELAMVKAGVLKALEKNPKNQILIDFIRVIERAENVK